MYNGIGLTTARGSGTNGYVQRNLSSLIVGKNHKSYDEVDREAAIFEQRLGRAPNKALLNHEKKRKIEIKCIELADLMLEQGFDDEEIKRKVASYREILKEKDPSISKVGKTDDESGKTKAESSHELAKLNEAQQEKLKSAFGISKDYKPGQAFTNGLGGGVFAGPPGSGPDGKTDGGCNGGDLPTAFDYVQSAGGIATQASYPDTSSDAGQTGKCKSSTPVVKVTGYEYAVPPCTGGKCNNQKESDMMAALNTYGPLSVCVNAQNWDGYSSGIYTTKCSGKYNALDHCVQLVGYDTTGSTSYWKVRNSWASSWGENGFIRLPMGTNACGIADEAMYVTATTISEEVAV